MDWSVWVSAKYYIQLWKRRSSRFMCHHEHHSLLNMSVSKSIYCSHVGEKSIMSYSVYTRTMNDDAMHYVFIPLPRQICAKLPWFTIFWGIIQTTQKCREWRWITANSADADAVAYIVRCHHILRRNEHSVNWVTFRHHRDAVKMKNICAFPSRRARVMERRKQSNRLLFLPINTKQSA